jgi:DNA-binding MarR family transcriptional regulator
MNNLDKAIVMFDQLSKAGKLGTLSLKIILYADIMDDAPLVSETANALKVSAAAISRTVDKLEEKGLLRRVREQKGDKREVQILITSKGAAFLKKMLAV